jgi:hypothetical protein
LARVRFPVPIIGDDGRVCRNVVGLLQIENEEKFEFIISEKELWVR